jgi:2-oxoglutarate dehydrogenase E1 component
MEDNQSDKPFLRQFHGPNAGYVLELYDRYRQDPASVDGDTRSFFKQITPPDMNGTGLAAVAPAQVDKIMGVVNLANAIREFGHLAANLDPLDHFPPQGDPTLELAHYGLTEADLRALPASLVGGPAAAKAGNALEAIHNLRDVYAATIGYDYDHMRVPQERDWLRHAAESRRFSPAKMPYDPVALLERLTKVETFELFLHRVYPGRTRFSIEGLDMLVPMLDVIVGGAADAGITTMLLGMAHRGRLNVLTHILGRSYEKILTEFKDPDRPDAYNARNYRGWTGDVKYHAGDRREIDLENDDIVDLIVNMAPNPSHLEHVGPVIAGMARAAGTFADQPGRPRFDHGVTLPIAIHGDASFSGQGVVAETLNMHRLAGFRVGGTIHIIANNQIGFTTNFWSGRSTRYASDLAKGFKIPIVHVNADDPEACIEVARLAIAYRQQFREDFLIDLVGYRRYGHNEGDEPRFTQPMMYQAIDEQPTVRQKWASTLVERGAIESERPDQMVEAQMETLQDIYSSLAVDEIAEGLEPQLEPPKEGMAKRAETAVDADRLRQLHRAVLEIPETFNLDEKIARAMQRQLTILDDAGERNVDWASAERLAFASILADGTAIRLTGEDVERGTFSQRHAVFRDTRDGSVYIPLQALPQAKAAFEIRNSPLSENAALGFEYGYNIQAPQRLIIWEAQYGDFINAGQAMVDEFIVSGNAKWEQTPSLVLLLPHAYEGQGPDHSSARLERFLQLAARTNIRVAYPTTASQYFHLLRRQAALLESDPLPLIVMSPKSLLRHARTASPLNELAHGGWQPVIDDPTIDDEAAGSVRRLVLCSGKVYVDLAVRQEKEEEETRVALVRLEQLYTFPAERVKEVLERYANVEEVIWLQEEPANMGAWDFVRPRLRTLIDGRWPLRYIGRPESASPAEGSSAWHKRNQAAIVEQAFEFKAQE